MNQILVTEKIYVTPELRRKRKLFKLQFFFCVFLVCLLFSYYIYAEYDRGKSEEVSQEILAGISKGDFEGIEEILIPNITPQEEQPQQSTVEYTTSQGQNYTVESIVRIPRLEINYPVIAETSEELLKISVNKYWGPMPNEVGNYCIVGHNYKSKKMFGRLSEAVKGDIIELEGMDGKVVKYSVYDIFTVDPNNTACTTQLTGGKREVTLITCTNYGTQRLIVKAREVK